MNQESKEYQNFSKCPGEIHLNRGLILCGANIQLLQNFDRYTRAWYDLSAAEKCREYIRGYINALNVYDLDSAQAAEFHKNYNGADLFRWETEHISNDFRFYPERLKDHIADVIFKHVGSNFRTAFLYRRDNTASMFFITIGIYVVIETE